MSVEAKALALDRSSPANEWEAEPIAELDSSLGHVRSVVEGSGLRKGGAECGQQLGCRGFGRTEERDRSIEEADLAGKVTTAMRVTSRLGQPVARLDGEVAALVTLCADLAGQGTGALEVETDSGVRLGHGRAEGLEPARMALVEVSAIRLG
jgi:hypothetical protein